MSQPAQGQPALDREPSPWTRPWFMVSAAVVAVLVALGVLYVVLPSPGAAPAPAQSPAVTAANTAQAGQTGLESVCGLPAGDQRYPSLNLPTKWELLGRVAVPTDSKGVGPGKVDGNVRTCFQHSPTGALYAAANFFATSTITNGDRIMYKDLSAKGPLRDQYLATPPPFSTGDSTVSVQVGGFRVQSYSAQAATIVLGAKNSKGGFGSVTVPLKWEDGDWKVNIDTLTKPSVITDLADFIPWAGA
ncbi:hypothetical protein [Arthrobacter bambusae]|uniref:hypothetical protein n=1 Tax=Arthrobacter bambusae TaxID=1338426 RepID=UPI002781310B|nr:hypothetical protein [Arthrobacter bambusae]MDQ0241470.1 hypothetical protein [Arthrobacter bambusae]